MNCVFVDDDVGVVRLAGAGVGAAAIAGPVVWFQVDAGVGKVVVEIVFRLLQKKRYLFFLTRKEVRIVSIKRTLSKILF